MILAVSWFLFAAAACSGDAANVPEGGDADATVLPDQRMVFPDGKDGATPGEDGKDGWQPEDGWFPDFKDPDDDTEGDGDQIPAGDVSLVCSKDSDCATAPLALQPCQKPMCDKHLGLCVPGPRSPGEPCDDDNQCTNKSVCTVSGECLGEDEVCDDGNICTTDTCLPDKGCIFKPNDNVCDDGNTCTTSDRCESGVCAGDETDDCHCTEDSDCDSVNDDNLCNGYVKCVFGTCKVPQSTLVFCDTSADSACKKTTCIPDTGECVQLARENGRPCNDGDECTTGDLCLYGECLGSAPKSCNDGNPCTNDTCDPILGCSNAYSLYPCEDGDECTVNDHCKLGACIPGPANTCDTGTCYPKWSLGCGFTDAWSTAGEGSTSNVDSYSCGPEEYAGPEYTYAFVAPFDGTATLAFEGDVTNMSVAVLEGRGTGCDADNCRGATNGVLTFDMFEDSSYYLVVDGMLEEGEEYGIGLDCTPYSELLCANGIDDDKDGETDCDDMDCDDSEECPDAECTAIWALGCNSKDFGSNYGLGSASAITSYSSITENLGCLDNQWEYPGPEFAYRFDAPGSFNVTVKLIGETAQTDLLILRDDGHGCNPLDCIAWGLKKVTFPAEAGETYFFVVDGYAGAQGSFDIEVACPLFVETQCSDGTDNDLDALTDCSDPDCVESVDCVGHCHPAKFVGCGFKEAFANFGWGSTSAVSEYTCSEKPNSYVYSGPEMAYQFEAPFDTEVTATLQLETASTDILVIEGTSCDPGNCLNYGLDSITFLAEEGKTYSFVVDGWKDALGTYLFELNCGPTTEVVCDDGHDNDGDGLEDCSDEMDCNLSAACPKCNAVYPLSCGDTDDWSNGGADSKDQILGYSCNSAVYDGPEFAYVFEPESTGEVTLELEAMGWDLDVFVLQDNGFGCNPAACIAWGTASVTFTAEKGQTYYFAVDGYGQAPVGFGPDFGTGDYQLSVICE